MESPVVFFEILDQLESVHKVSASICVPVCSMNDDEWKNKLMKNLKPKDEEFKGSIIRKGRTNSYVALKN